MTTDECEKCAYALIDDTNKARVKVICSHREKEYWWGQYVPCEDFRKRDKGYENSED